MGKSLEDLGKRIRETLLANPGQIVDTDSAFWAYQPVRFVDLDSLSIGDVFYTDFDVHERFAHTLYRAQCGGRFGSEVVIDSPQPLPHSRRFARVRCIVKVKEERQFQRAFGTTVVLPVIEMLYLVPYWP